MVYGQAGAAGGSGDEWDARPGHCGRDAQGDWINAPTAGPQLRRWRITDQTLPAESDSSRWQAADLAAGHPWVRSATQDMFLPTTFDMDLNGGIDFRKGCYPGQEVIARTHYRGTVKRRLAYGTAPWTTAQGDLPAPAADLYQTDGDGRPVARIIDCVRVDDTVHVAAEITLSDWPAMRYSLVSAQGPALALVPLHTDQSR
ncbi:MAG TPA: tRNA-modifying protein YgfZ [Castellaniella sp.]|nr:tRNA-modifying protein YgfZ [Castellaniella sp.]